LESSSSFRPCKNIWDRVPESAARATEQATQSTAASQSRKHRQAKRDEYFEQASAAPDCAAILDPPVDVENCGIDPRAGERIRSEETGQRIARQIVRNKPK
jgi:hypothetical protein